jgi:aspartyl-tRNA synthetase
MPPTAGFGCGIDRLCMLMCGVTHIREIILFPMFRTSILEGAGAGSSFEKKKKDKKDKSAS